MEIRADWIVETFERGTTSESIEVQREAKDEIVLEEDKVRS